MTRSVKRQASSPKSEPLFDVAIVGGGCSGTLVAVRLLQAAKRQLKVALIEKAAPCAGVAYGTLQPSHLLNVPAGRMSALIEDPEHFLRWARGRSEAIAAGDFLPRALYREYLLELLDSAVAAAPGCQLERLSSEVVHLEARPKGSHLTLANGSSLSAQLVVLALGNYPPANPVLADSSFYQSARYQANPWAEHGLVGGAQTRNVLLIGTGLTALDMALSMHHSGHAGLVHAVSPRGLLPEPHAPTPPLRQPMPPWSPGTPVSALVRLVRARAEQAEAEGSNWRAVVDALRPQTQALWQQWSETEKRRFLRHVRPYWDTHRHRSSVQVDAVIKSMIAAGKLRIYAGHLRAVVDTGAEAQAHIRLRGTATDLTLNVDRVINCTGPQLNYRRLEAPLVRSLLAAGLIQPHALFGLAVAPGGALIGSDGKPSQSLFTLGPPQSGELWESTAVPEIRQQAADLAQGLLAALAEAQLKPRRAG